MSHSSKMLIPAAILSLAILHAVPAAHAQEGAGGMWASMVKLGGMMHATARKCGGYTDAQLHELKQKQKATSGERGVSAAEFEKVFTDAEAEVVRRWSTMSPSQQAQACKDIKQQMSMSR